MHAVYNSIDSDAISQQAAETVDHPWFGPGQPPVLLGVGRFTEQKDFPTLVRAFAELRKQLECHLLILGDGPDRPGVRALAECLGIGESVQMPGFEANPYKYMARCNVFVLSSRYEGLPNVLIEAQACGVPVISTDCPTGPREILDGGACGLLVKVDDANGMSEAMFKLLVGKESADGYVAASARLLDRFAAAEAYRSNASLLEVGPSSG